MTYSVFVHWWSGNIDEHTGLSRGEAHDMQKIYDALRSVQSTMIGCDFSPLITSCGDQKSPRIPEIEYNSSTQNLNGELAAAANVPIARQQPKLPYTRRELCSKEISDRPNASQWAEG